MSKRVLISGGGGYLGFRTALNYLKNTDAELLLSVHARDSDELAKKSEMLKMAAGIHASRIETIRIELEDASPFASIDPASVDEIIHSAAVIRFNVEADVAQKINIEGTQKVLDFASQCGNHKTFGLFSSIYSSGLSKGAITETRFTDQDGFANHYERSKWASEELLLNQYSSLPWKIFRVSTVLADRDDGTCIQQNAVHNTLKLVYYGLISLIPGRPSTPTYFVNGDFVADAVFEAMERFPTEKIYHVCHSKEQTITLGEIIDVAYEAFSSDPQFKSRRLLKPLFTDEGSFNALVKGATAFGGNVLSQAVTSIAPFGVQLFIEKDVRNDELTSRMSHYVSPNPREQIRKTCEFLAATKFKKLDLTGIAGGTHE
jgi:nucleoside-diphosphate-sugar epimerase